MEETSFSLILTATLVGNRGLGGLGRLAKILAEKTFEPTPVGENKAEWPDPIPGAQASLNFS